MDTADNSSDQLRRHDEVSAVSIVSRLQRPCEDGNLAQGDVMFPLVATRDMAEASATILSITSAQMEGLSERTVRSFGSSAVHDGSPLDILVGSVDTAYRG